jgi:type IV fimbrial biogenesis protein FimT
MKTCNESIEHPRNGAGFTLIELMIGIAIAAIILTLGIPSFSEVIRNNRIAVQSNELVSALHLARSEAIKRSATVRVCSSTDGATCANNASWATGWVVLDVAGNVLRTWDAIGGGLTLTGPAAAIQFLSSGFSNSQQTLRLRPDDCTYGRNILVSATGRPYTDDPDCP